MYLFAVYPIQMIALFSLPPLVGGLIAYQKTINKSVKTEKFMGTAKGIMIGLLIDVPFLCFVLWEFSSM